MTRVWLAVIALLLIALTLSRLQYLGLERDVAKVKEAHALQLKTISDEALAAQMSATQHQADKAKEVATLDAKHYGELTNANSQIDRLMAAVDAGRQRLFIAAKCSADPNRVPQAASAGSVDHDPGPRLTSAAEQHYFDLWRGIAKVTAQLAACQEYAAIVSGVDR